MNPRPSPNRAALLALVGELGPLLDDLVFVGGHVAELLITSSGATRVRPTVDVDVVTSATTIAAYHGIERRLRELGFRNDLREDAPTCRWLSPSGIVLDVMPSSERVLGVSNRWYPLAVSTSQRFDLTPDVSIRVPHAAVFLATKWAAVEGRAGADVIGSRDMEDIIAVVAGRDAIVAEIAESPHELRNWLAAKAAEFLGHADAEYALQGALPDAAVITELIPRVRSRFEEISRLLSVDRE